MENSTKYPQLYLDRMLPDATCPHCMSDELRRRSVREAGQYLIVSYECEDCKTQFNVRYNTLDIRTAHDNTTRNTREMRQERPKQKVIPKRKTKTSTKKVKKKEPLPTDPKEKKKLLYNSIASGCNIVSLIVFVSFAMLMCYDLYDLTVNYNNAALSYFIITGLVMVGLLVVTQTISIIYRIIGK